MGRKESESALLGEVLPDPYSVGGPSGQREPELMREHAHLSAVMGVMRDHVGEHGDARRPWPGPAIAHKTLDAALGSGQSFCQHLGTALGTLGQRRSRLLLGAPAAVKPRW